MPSRPTPSSDEIGPISHQAFHILLSLSDEPRHGYGILLEVEERTGGEVMLGTGTLYSVIKRLRGHGLIEETEYSGEANDDPRRKYYLLTALGRGVVTAEAARLEAMVSQARDKEVLPAEASS